MEKSTIPIGLIIEPKSFHPDVFYDNVLEKVKMKEMTCEPNFGYIDQIFQVIDLKGMSLLDDGNCKVTAFVECNIFKPSIGLKVDVNIIMISEHGIFAEIGKNKFLVPINKIESFMTFRNGSFYHNTNPTIQIHTQDKMKVEITDFRYDNNKCYCCIASLILPE
jgi:DNA-directed RNA polymerase subunit E'/Rpb7